MNTSCVMHHKFPATWVDVFQVIWSFTWAMVNMSFLVIYDEVLPRCVCVTVAAILFLTAGATLGGRDWSESAEARYEIFKKGG